MELLIVGALDLSAACPYRGMGVFVLQDKQVIPAKLG